MTAALTSQKMILGFQRLGRQQQQQQHSLSSTCHFLSSWSTTTIRALSTSRFLHQHHHDHGHSWPSSSSSSSSSRTTTSSNGLSTTSSSCGARRGFSSSSSSSSSIHVMDKLFNPTEEHAALRSTLRNFVEREVEPQAHVYNKAEKFNIKLFHKLGTMQNDGLGLLGLTVPDELGGCNMDAVAVAMVHEELSYSDPAFCLSYLAHTILLVHNLTMNASRSQLERLLPDLISGCRIGGMGMSEASSGTDVLGMKTIATSIDNGNGFCLNGTKMWITNGTLGNGDLDQNDDTPYELGDVFLVYARTGPNKSDITQFILEKGMSGFTLGSPIKDKLGMRASMTAELVFDNVILDKDAHVVGQVNGATYCMMRNLEMERLALASMALGIARRCIDEMKQYAMDRTGLFKQTNLFAFGQVQQMISESYANYMAGKCYVYALAHAIDEQTKQQGDKNSSGHISNGLDADGTKLYCAQMAKTVADYAIQVLGGNGYVAEYKVERLWRDAKLLEIGGGTNQSHHKNMSRDLYKMTTRGEKLP